MPPDKRSGHPPQREPAPEISATAKQLDLTAIECTPAGDTRPRTEPDPALRRRHLEEGRRRRDEGVEYAAFNTWWNWSDAAREFVDDLPAGTELTSDTIISTVGMPTLSSKNAVGALVQGLLRSGVIAWTGRVAQSTRATRRGAWIKVYRRVPATAAEGDHGGRP